MSMITSFFAGKTSALRIVITECIQRPIQNARFRTPVDLGVG